MRPARNTELASPKNRSYRSLVFQFLVVVWVSRMISSGPIEPLPFESTAMRSSLRAKAPAASRVNLLSPSLREMLALPEKASDREFPVERMRPADALAFHSTPFTSSGLPYSNFGSCAPAATGTASAPATMATSPNAFPTNRAMVRQYSRRGAAANNRARKAARGQIGAKMWA